MILKRINKIATCGIAAGILFLGCAPTTYTHRYSAEAQKESVTGTAETRFPAENSSLAENNFPVEKKLRSGKKILSRNRAGQAASISSPDTRSNTSKTTRFSTDNDAAMNSYLAMRPEGKSGSTRSENFKDTVNFRIPDYLEEDDEDMDEDLPVEKSVDISHLLREYSAENPVSSSPDSVNTREKVLMEVIKYLNTPYLYGGNSKDGIDCSAFTKTVFNNTLSFGLPRSAREQYQLGDEIEAPEDLKFGDLVFFNTRRRVRPGHVGIYLGHNLFAHASSHQGVIVSSLDSTYYQKRFMGGRRMENVVASEK